MTHKLVILLCLFVVTDTALLPAWGEGELLESPGGSSVCLSTVTSQGRIGYQTLPGLWTERTWEGLTCRFITRLCFRGIT